MATTSSPSEANTAFALDLFKKLAEEDKTGNIFFSPFSISSALAMVMLGTRGNTNTQMSEVLRFTQPLDEEGTETQPMRTDMQCPMQSQLKMREQIRTQVHQSSRLPTYLLKVLKKESDLEDDIHAKFGQLLGQLNTSPAPYTLSIANKLYGEQTFNFLEEFLSEIGKHYTAELESVDFKNAAEEARANINGWVEQKTEGKIKDLLVEGVLSDATRLVLVNAVYFKGKWMQQFKEAETVDAQFRINKNDTKPVKMMRQKSKFTFTEIPEEKLQILELRYEEGAMSMLIFLPNELEDETTGLERLETVLTTEKFVDWTDPEKMGEAEIEVTLPRFKLEEMYDLKEILIRMGMGDAFDSTFSDFSAMSSNNDLVLSEVVHKAFVEVNEEGTEAAAATAAVISERSVAIPVIFNADHPFLFVIQHRPTKTVLFAGRYSTPE